MSLYDVPLPSLALTRAINELSDQQLGIRPRLKKKCHLELSRERNAARNDVFMEVVGEFHPRFSHSIFPSLFYSTLSA